MQKIRHRSEVRRHSFFFVRLLSSKMAPVVDIADAIRDRRGSHVVCQGFCEARATPQERSDEDNYKSHSGHVKLRVRTIL